MSGIKPIDTLWFKNVEKYLIGLRNFEKLFQDHHEEKENAERGCFITSVENFLKCEIFPNFHEIKVLLESEERLRKEIPKLPFRVILYILEFVPQFNDSPNLSQTLDLPMYGFRSGKKHLPSITTLRKSIETNFATFQRDKFRKIYQITKHGIGYAIFSGRKNPSTIFRGRHERSSVRFRVGKRSFSNHKDIVKEGTFTKETMEHFSMVKILLLTLRHLSRRESVVEPLMDFTCRNFRNVRVLILTFSARIRFSRTGDGDRSLTFDPSFFEKFSKLTRLEVSYGKFELSKGKKWKFPPNLEHISLGSSSLNEEVIERIVLLKKVKEIQLKSDDSLRLKQGHFVPKYLKNFHKVLMMKSLQKLNFRWYRGMFQFPEYITTSEISELIYSNDSIDSALNHLEIFLNKVRFSSLLDFNYFTSFYTRRREDYVSLEEKFVKKIEKLFNSICQVDNFPSLNSLNIFLSCSRGSFILGDSPENERTIMKLTNFDFVSSQNLTNLDVTCEYDRKFAENIQKFEKLKKLSLSRGVIKPDFIEFFCKTNFPRVVDLAVLSCEEIPCTIYKLLVFKGLKCFKLSHCSFLRGKNLELQEFGVLDVATDLETMNIVVEMCEVKNTKFFFDVLTKNISKFPILEYFYVHFSYTRARHKRTGEIAEKSVESIINENVTELFRSLISNNVNIRARQNRKDYYGFEGDEETSRKIKILIKKIVDEKRMKEEGKKVKNLGFEELKSYVEEFSKFGNIRIPQKYSQIHSEYLSGRFNVSLEKLLHFWTLFFLPQEVILKILKEFVGVNPLSFNDIRKKEGEVLSQNYGYFKKDGSQPRKIYQIFHNFKIDCCTDPSYCFYGVPKLPLYINSIQIINNMEKNLEKARREWRTHQSVVFGDNCVVKKLCFDVKEGYPHITVRKLGTSDGVNQVKFKIENIEIFNLNVDEDEKMIKFQVWFLKEIKKFYDSKGGILHSVTFRGVLSVKNVKYFCQLLDNFSKRKKHLPHNEFKYISQIKDGKGKDMIVVFDEWFDKRLTKGWGETAGEIGEEVLRRKTLVKDILAPGTGGETVDLSEMFLKNSS